MSQSCHFVGLDVSAKTTSICIVDNANEIVAEGKVPTDPEAITRFIDTRAGNVTRVGLEAGLMSEWLYVELTKAGLPMFCIEARHARGFIQSQINKNDRNDARGISRMMMCGVFRPVHIKSDESLRQRAMLATRKIILDKMTDIELHIRGTLKIFGHSVGPCTKALFSYRVDELVAGDDALAAAIVPLLYTREMLGEQFNHIHRQVLAIARDDPVCQLLMTAPGVGAITALTFKTSVDTVDRLRGTKSVGALFGMTPRQYQSGETNHMGGISKLGGDDLRIALCEAGMKILVNVRQPSALRTWGLEMERRQGRAKAAVAVGRRLGSILRRMWLDGCEFAPHAGGPSAPVQSCQEPNRASGTNRPHF